MLLCGVGTASATFHEMVVREVYPGSAMQADAEYVELQMWSPGQSFVSGHSIGIYDATGALAGSSTFAHDVSGDANQSTLVAATAAAEAAFGIAADATLPPGLLDPAGGAVCWESLDCVSWGSFSGMTTSPAGRPAVPAGIPDGMALRRTIEPGCATLLEASDDRDDSSTDFAPAFPSPRPNSVVPSERACSAQSGTGGSPGSGGGVNPGTSGNRPQTRIVSHPGHRTDDRTPTFRFASSTAGSTYLCRLDRAPFRRCRSPFTVPRLRLGHHVLAVAARAPQGAADRSPATYGFTVVRAGGARHRQSV
jgi:hypothetical protein